MSDFKFNCPSCGQHLSGDERYGGLQITCPACTNAVLVPPARSAAAAMRMVPSAPPPPPRPAAPVQTQTCGLATASLICSIGSILVGPLGFLPGIICGHIAKKRIAANPGLQGAGMAKAGLIIGYLALILTVLCVLAFVGFVFFVAHRAQQMMPAAGS